MHRFRVGDIVRPRGHPIDGALVVDWIEAPSAFSRQHPVVHCKWLNERGEEIGQMALWPEMLELAKGE